MLMSGLGGTNMYFPQNQQPMFGGYGYGQPYQQQQPYQGFGAMNNMYGGNMYNQQPQYIHSTDGRAIDPITGAYVNPNSNGKQDPINNSNSNSSTNNIFNSTRNVGGYSHPNNSVNQNYNQQTMFGGYGQQQPYSPYGNVGYSQNLQYGMNSNYSPYQQQQPYGGGGYGGNMYNQQPYQGFGAMNNMYANPQNQFTNGIPSGNPIFQGQMAAPGNGYHPESIEYKSYNHSYLLNSEMTNRFYRLVSPMFNTLVTDLFTGRINLMVFQQEFHRLINMVVNNNIIPEISQNVAVTNAAILEAIENHKNNGLSPEQADKVDKQYEEERQKYRNSKSSKMSVNSSNNEEATYQEKLDIYNKVKNTAHFVPGMEKHIKPEDR